MWTCFSFLLIYFSDSHYSFLVHVVFINFPLIISHLSLFYQVYSLLSRFIIYKMIERKMCFFFNLRNNLQQSLEYKFVWPKWTGLPRAGLNIRREGGISRGTVSILEDKWLVSFCSQEAVATHHWSFLSRHQIVVVYTIVLAGLWENRQRWKELIDRE